MDTTLVDTGKLLYNPEEGAHKIGVSRSQMFILLRDGAIKSVRIGRSRRIPAQALIDYVAQLEAQ